MYRWRRKVAVALGVACVCYCIWLMAAHARHGPEFEGVGLRGGGEVLEAVTVADVRAGGVGGSLPLSKKASERSTIVPAKKAASSSARRASTRSTQSTTALKKSSPMKPKATTARPASSRTHASTRRPLSSTSPRPSSSSVSSTPARAGAEHITTISSSSTTTTTVLSALKTTKNTATSPSLTSTSERASTPAHPITTSSTTSASSRTTSSTVSSTTTTNTANHLPSLRPCSSPTLFTAACRASLNNRDPDIYALMITGKDREHLPLAHLSMRSFELQTYPWKAMIIINDGDMSVLGPLPFTTPVTLPNQSHFPMVDFSSSTFFSTTISSPSHLSSQSLASPSSSSSTTTHTNPFASNPCICEHRVRKSADVKLGHLRNLAMSLVPQKKVWVQWDDDDFRMPHCMAGQYEDMRNFSADMVFLKRQIHVDMLWNSTFKYEYGHWGLWGTLMVNTTKEAARTMAVPNVDRGEDLYYDDARAKLTYHVWDNEPQMYYRIIHGRNTWDRAHFKPDTRFRRNTWCLLMEQWCTPTVKDMTHAVFRLYRDIERVWNSTAQDETVMA